MSDTFTPLDFPAWIVWGRRRGATLFQPEGRGPNGRRLCRWCAGEIPQRARCWCGMTCVAKYLRISGWCDLREYIFERDGGHCQRCSADCSTEIWEVDHILRIIDGGDDNPSNLRLLCAKCHIAVGYEQRKAVA